MRAEAIPKKSPGEDQIVELTWELPAEDSPINTATELVIEVKPKTSSVWVERKTITITDRRYSLTTENLKEYIDYEFRIIAKNKAGKSQPSKPSNTVQLGEILILPPFISLKNLF